MASTAWNGIKSTTSTIWIGVKAILSTVWSDIKSTNLGGINIYVERGNSGQEKILYPPE